MSRVCVCVCWSLNMMSPPSPGSLPLKRRMDDEEEDMSRPISQLWGTPFRDIKYQDQATQMAGQALAVVPTSQRHNNNSIGSSRPSCGLQWQPHVPFQGKEGGGWNPTGCLTLIAALHSQWLFYRLTGNHPRRQEWLKLSVWFDFSSDQSQWLLFSFFLVSKPTFVLPVNHLFFFGRPCLVVFNPPAELSQYSFYVKYPKSPSVLIYCCYPVSNHISVTSFNLYSVAVKECCLYVGPVLMCEACIVLALKSLIQKASQAAIPPSIIVTKPVMDVMHLSQFQLRWRGVPLQGSTLKHSAHAIRLKITEFSVAWQQKHMLEAMSKLKRQKHFCSRRFVVGLISCLRILDSLFLFWVVAGEVVICLPELIKSPFVFQKATWQHMYCRHSCVWGRAYLKSGHCQSFLPISSHLTLTAFWGRGGVEGHSGNPFP